MMMTVLISLFMSFSGVLFLTLCLFSEWFTSPSRYSVVKKQVYNFLNNLFPSLSLTTTLILTSLMSTLLVLNLSGNIPLNTIGSMYYYLTVSMSMILWLSIMIVVSKTQLYSFISHMLPYGSPMALMLFLPLVEIFSQFIRPFTLMIRLSTNLSSGHIMLFMFSYFSIPSFIMTSSLFIFLSALYILELAIAALQAYIFSSLTYLYIMETV